MNPRARRTDVIVENIGSELLVYDRLRDRVHSLDPVAAHVYQHADGTLAVHELVALVRESVDPAADDELIAAALGELERVHLLDAEPATPGGKAWRSVTRRDAVRYLGALAVTPMISSIDSPGFGAGASDHDVCGGPHKPAYCGPKSVSFPGSKGKSSKGKSSKGKSKGKSSKGKSKGKSSKGKSKGKSK